MVPFSRSKRKFRFSWSPKAKRQTSKGDNMRQKTSFCFCAVLAVLLCLTVPELAGGQRRHPAQVGGNLLPDGFYITPTAAPGSIFQDLPTGLRSDGSANANGAVNTALSPDGSALLILTTGYNTGFDTQDLAVPLSCGPRSTPKRGNHRKRPHRMRSGSSFSTSAAPSPCRSN